MNKQEEKTTPFGYPLSRVYHTSPFGVLQSAVLTGIDDKKASKKPIPERDTQVIIESPAEDISQPQ